MILKMELKTHLTSELQLSGPEAAFKNRNCGCDMKAETHRCFVPPSKRDCILYEIFPKSFSAGLVWSYSSLYKKYSLLFGLLSFWLREERWSAI